MSTPAPAVQQKTSNLEQAARRFSQEIRTDLENDALVWPSVPSGVFRIRKVASDPDSSAEDLARVAATDPALATKFLQVANSVYYASLTPCKDLRSAVVRLGARAIEQVTLLFVVAQVYSVGSRRRIQPYLKRLWHHSTEVAAIAERLAEPYQHLHTDTAMLAGLTHDIGALPVLVRAEKVPKLIENPPLTDKLVRRLHCEVGQAMLAAWHFPDELVAVVSGHEHLPREPGEKLDYVDLVTAANLLSRGPPGTPEFDRYAGLAVFAKLGLDREALTELCEAAKARQATLGRL